MWPFAKREGCLVCEQKNQLIETLMKREEKPCQSCATLHEENKYLRSLLENEKQARREERDEFKRAVDRILEIVGSRPVGQGVQQAAPQQQITAKDLFGIFQEEPETAQTK